MLACWLFSQLITSRTVYICRNDGTLLTAAYPLLCHMDQLDWYSWVWPTDGHDELTGSYNRAIESGETEYFWKRFRYLDPISGTIVSNKVADPAPESEVRLFLHQSEVVNDLHGWSLCFKEADFPDTVEEFMAEIGFQAKRLVHAKLPEQSRKFGRPSLQKHAWNAFVSEFPNGRGQVPWKTVEKHVSMALDRDVSARTIQRAINEFGSDTTE